LILNSRILVKQRPALWTASTNHKALVDIFMEEATDHLNAGVVFPVTDPLQTRSLIAISRGGTERGNQVVLAPPTMKVNVIASVFSSIITGSGATPYDIRSGKSTLNIDLFTAFFKKTLLSGSQCAASHHGRVSEVSFHRRENSPGAAGGVVYSEEDVVSDFFFIVVGATDTVGGADPDALMIYDIIVSVDIASFMAPNQKSDFVVEGYVNSTTSFHNVISTPFTQDSPMNVEDLVLPSGVGSFADWLAETP